MYVVMVATFNSPEKVEGGQWKVFLDALATAIKDDMEEMKKDVLNEAAAASGGQAGPPAAGEVR